MLIHENPSQGHVGSSDLEERLNQKPTLDTDVMEFLIQAGLGGWWLYARLCEKQNEELRNLIKEKYYVRRAKLPAKTKARETSVTHCLWRGYEEGKFKTIRELKEFIETKGTVNAPIGYTGIGQLNETLKHYGIEPIKVSGYENHMRKYRIEHPRYYPG